jgi:hypothetical protein
MRERLVVFCDESIERGEYFSHFYGAALVREKQLERVNAILRMKKSELSLHGEVKFAKITSNYQAKYIALLETFFELISEQLVKVRIMFSQNIHKPTLTHAQRDNTYFLLYYQLVKHSFGLQYMEGALPISLRLNFDAFPTTREKAANFKGYICGLTQSREFREREISIEPQDIAEVESHNHDILQCLDIILGLMQWRLNEGHKTKAEGKKQRSNRTKAKEKVYKFVYAKIRELYPGYAFNIGVTTKFSSKPEFQWTASYRHWLFVPRERERNLHYVPKKK